MTTDRVESGESWGHSSPRDLESLSERVYESLRQVGIPIHPASRVARELAALKHVGRFLLDKDSRLHLDPDFIHALEDLPQLSRIAAFLRGPHEDPEIAMLASAFLSDACSPHASARTPGRDAQFELYFAATCRKSAYLVRRQDPPDFLVTPLVGVAGNLGEVGVAVKRVKSREKLATRVREGCHQLRKTKSGFVVLDISMMVNREGQRLLVQPGAEGVRQVARLVDQYVLSNIGKLAGAVDSAPTLGLLFHASLQVGEEVAEGIVLPGIIERWFNVPVHPRFQDISIAFGMEFGTL